MNLTDLVLSQQGAMQSLARENGLSDSEMRAAVEALVPAFSAGLERNTREPARAASLLQALGSGRHQRFLDDPSTIDASEGNAILGHLFGRKKVSRQVAQQAAARSGLSQSLLKSLLPKLAPIILGALVKGMSGGRGRGGGIGNALGQAAGGGLLGSLVESVADGFLGGARSGMGRRMPTSRRRRAGRQGSGLGLEELLGGMLNGAAAAPTRTRAAPRRLRRMRTSTPTPTGVPTTTRTPRRTGSGSARGDALIDQLLGEAPRRSRSGGSGGLFGQAAQPGPATDPDYQNDMGSIFERMLGR